MIDKCYFILGRLCSRSMASIGSIRSFQASVMTSYRKKVVVKKEKRDSKRRAVIWQGMKIGDLAKSMETSASNVKTAICRLLETNDNLPTSMELTDVFLITQVAKLCGYIVDLKQTEKLPEIEDKDVYCRDINLNADRLKPRPPIVTIMGHVDHGKTTLLDSLRSSRIVDSEFGGITQHIGAFKVKLSDISGKEGSDWDQDSVTFLDTPGHAAFSLMRSRGANCTDIVILVVAIDDGIMPQTLESIRFAKEARVPMIVVVNKIDKVIKTVDEIDRPHIKKLYHKVHESLSKHGIIVEELGGDVQCIPISAQKKWNIDLLQESILVLSEMMNIRCDYEGLCEGVILETKIADHVGKVSTILLQQGTLKPGSFLVAGNSMAKVRTIKSDGGQLIKEARPGDPVEVSGWKDSLPLSGDIAIEVESDGRAKEVISYRKALVSRTKSEKDYEMYRKRMESYKASYKAYMDEGYKQGFRLWKDRPQVMDFTTTSTIVNGVEIPELNLIIKTDVNGSMEAIENLLRAAIEGCADQCSVKIAHISVGNLSENDVRLASFTNSIVYLFNLPHSMSIDAKLGIDVRHFNVIYHMFDNIRDTIVAILPPTSSTEVVGEATVLEIFETRENRQMVPIAGAKCVSGSLFKDKSQYLFRVSRIANTDGEQEIELVQDGLICKSLRHIRSDVDSIRKGVECGMLLVDNCNEPYPVKKGDLIQCYKLVYTPQTLNWNLGF